MSIRKRHEGHYFGYGAGVPIELCWWCQRSRAVCKSKVRYPAPREAHEAALGLNAGAILEKPVSPYVCGWCEGWHLTSRMTKFRVRAIEKQRRKALARA